ncbi:MAG: thymidine kinase [Alphaproteobacteria bacterium]|nr:thymidine kinase [Alphaproteobacteria bacterium]
MAKLHFYYSAMNAGKTTVLLQSSYNYNERGMETIMFIPILDDRYEVGTITSRIGLDSKAVPFGKDFDFFDYVSEQCQTRSIKCVLVDEAQFLSKDQVHQLTDIVDTFGMPILTYGLRTDFKGETFEGSHYLLALAEDITEIKTICHCGRKATMNMRVSESGKKVQESAQVEVGGNELYVATCRKHFKEGDSGPMLKHSKPPLKSVS